MNTMKHVLGSLIHLFISLMLVFCITGYGQASDPLIFHHNLDIELLPKKQALFGLDRINVQGRTGDTLDFHLFPDAVINRVSSNGIPLTYTFKNGLLRVELQTRTEENTASIEISYRAVFDDYVPVQVLNTDDPGYGVRGTLSEKGAFLLSSAKWYPIPSAGKSTFILDVKAPKGMLAVTQGKLKGILHKNGFSTSSWEIRNSVELLSLCAGRYIVAEQSYGAISIQTFLSKENAALSDQYLGAAAGYLKTYESLFGPYPFEKFAVVENFFPTGYGFPSYTVLGARVIRLPFIIHTSLGHEIAHCWWGNGVGVDDASGNWCEGLTTYVSDYYFKEKKSVQAAQEYRRQILQDYAVLVAPESDFPVTRFQSRTDPATRTIGYGKTAMIFHMLRNKVGEKRFWETLSGLFREFVFKTISWTHIQKAFELQAPGLNLGAFFDQWLDRPGALNLSLEQVEATAHGSGYTIKGMIVQKPPYYRADIQLELQSQKKKTVQSLKIKGQHTRFEFKTLFAPVKMVADPHYDLFRKLDKSEIPFTINALKGADAVTIVPTDDASGSNPALAGLMVQSLGLKNPTLKRLKDLSEKELLNNNLLFIGLPKDPAIKNFILKALPDQITIDPKGFKVNGHAYKEKKDALFIVVKHPDQPEKLVAMYYPLSFKNADLTARKITHYGKYSFLVFSKHRNRAKGTWPVQTSPLVYRF